MRSTTAKIQKLLEPHSKVVACLIALVLLLDVMVAVKDPTRALADKQDVAASASQPTQTGSGPARPAVGSKGASSRARALAARPVSKLAKYKAGAFIKGVGTIPLGVDFKTRTIKLVYYWKGNRDTSGAAASMGGSGQAQLDEADAFRRYVAYINKHANDSPTRSCVGASSSCFMGFPFNLHGFKIDEACIQPHKPCIVEAGEDQTGWNTAAQKVVGLSPLAAVSSHGGLSDYACPILADAHIFNPITYNLYPGLVKKTNGYCLPAGISWEKQVELTIPWLKKQNATPYNGTACPAGTVTCKRVYGILFAEYDGEAKAVEGFKDKLLAAGINLGKSKSTNGYSIYSVSTSLTAAAQQQPGRVDQFKNDGVNTIIAPDSGAEITFTHAAESVQYRPDYYVWPCSGEDAEGQVRLYDPHQWTTASGLSCYDQNWNLDLTLDTNARSTQWFRQYQEIACPGQSSCNIDPPSTAPLVYQGLLPVLIGITAAGADITVEDFFAGLKAFKHYRYNAITGPTASESNFQLTTGSPDGSQIGDVAKVKWNGTKQTPGNTSPGAYDYSTTRYKPGTGF